MYPHFDIFDSMAPSKALSGKKADALYREQRALFAQATAKHKIRVAEEAKLKSVDSQLEAVGENASNGGPVVDVPVEKAIQEPVKSEINTPKG